MTDIPTPQMPRQDERCDARDLLARLYREIGISAVAAALYVAPPKSDLMSDLEQKKPVDSELINRLRGIAA